MTGAVEALAEALLASIAATQHRALADAGWRVVGPDCPHHCEEGHLTGDDMVMAEIGTGWPARWEAAIAERERLLRRLRSMIEDPMVDTPTLLDEVDRMLARVGDDR